MSRIKLPLPKVASRLRLRLIMLRHAHAPQREGDRLETPMADGIRGQRQLFHRTSPANTVVLESPKVSRRHALIHLQNIGELWLIDFGSSNGTFLNKRRIHHPIRLNDGDQITIGDQVFKVRDPVAISEQYKTDLMQGTFARDRDCSVLASGFRHSRFYAARRQMQSQEPGRFCRSVDSELQGVL